MSLLVDGFWRVVRAKGFFQPLVDAEARFCRFVPRWGRRYLLRNHQKLALADGRRVIIGGFNISDDYFGTIEQGAWRDLGLMVEGPSVALPGPLFRRPVRLGGSRGRLDPRAAADAEHASVTDGPLHWLFGGPTRRLSPWARSVKADMLRATRLDMIVAYFAPSLSMLRRIFGVARRGRARIDHAGQVDHQCDDRRGALPLLACC